MFVERLLKPFTQVTGLALDEACYTIATSLCFFFGFIFRTTFHIKNVSSTTRHYVSMAAGLLLLLFCFGSEMLHIVFMSFYGYILINSVSHNQIHKYMFATSMLHNSVVHINRMLSLDHYVIDISAPLMFATMKSIYLGFAFYDAHTAKQDTKIKKNETPNTDENLNIEKKITPTTLEYFSYLFFFGSILIGPASNFHSFKKFIDGKEFLQHKFTSKGKKVENPSCEPSPVIPAFTKYIVGHAFIVSYLLLAPYYKPERLGESSRLNVSLVSNLIFNEMVLYLVKAKYYCVFIMGEACNNAAGFGFNGYDENGKEQWDKLINVKPLHLEAAQNVKGINDSWNMQTNKWLRDCIYKRVSFVPLLSTMLMSAVWHGFFAGYYVFFVLYGTVIYVERKLRHKIRPYFLNSIPLKFAYDVTGWFLNRITVTYICIAFSMLDMPATIRFWRATYGIGFIILIIGIILTLVLPDVHNDMKSNRMSSGDVKKKKET